MQKRRENYCSLGSYNVYLITVETMHETEIGQFLFERRKRLGLASLHNAISLKDWCQIFTQSQVKPICVFLAHVSPYFTPS